MAGDDPGQQREVVLDDVLVDRHRGHVDHPQPRLAQEQQQEEEALLHRLVHRTRGGPEPVDAHRRHDDDRLEGVALAHEPPHLGQPLLQDVEALAPRLLVEVVEPAAPGSEARVTFMGRLPLDGADDLVDLEGSRDAAQLHRAERAVSKRSSRPARTRGLMRIWRAAAAAHSRAATLVTVPMAA